MKPLRIKDLYAGKPDAKDELACGNTDTFIKTYVVSEYFDIESLLYKDKCFITGFKGTGKTALLFYLDDQLQSADQNVCTSYIFFKDDYPEIKRQELQTISHRIVSSITIESGALLQSEDFEYIWRWLFFKRIISDNQDYNRNLFEDDDNWVAFENLMKRIKDPHNNTRMRIPKKIKMAVPIKNEQAGIEVAPELEINLGDPKNTNYSDFVSVIDEAEILFSSVKRTDIPYYIFVDELEAYYGDSDVFKRDLGLIRDLVFTVKRFNMVFQSNSHSNTKVICSVRSEILNAINRFIVTKELNKITSGFSVPLTWNYTNSNSYAHPLIQIILKRIASCSDNPEENALETYKSWFPEMISGIEPANYILNNSWCKPRDMVRFIMTAQNSIHQNDTAFTQAVFDSLAREYSEESLKEIVEELHALYTPAETDVILNCFTGYKTRFTYNELKERITQYYSGTILEKNLNNILTDLYRLGFLGNYMPATKSYHWQHKGDTQLILNDDWQLFIHYALHNVLSLRTKNDRAIDRKKKPKNGDQVLFTIERVLPHCALGHFSMYGKNYKGSIHVFEFSKHFDSFVWDLTKTAAEGDEINAIIQEYSDEFRCWQLIISE